MKVNAGLYPNANPSLVNSDTKSYALNVLYNEDGETLINENGFEKHHDYSDYGQCIGTIPIPVGVVLFFVNRNGANPSVPDGDYIIWHSDETIEGDIKYSDVIYKAPLVGNSTVLNFSEDRPITGAYSYNKNNHLIITFTEGNSTAANETRLMNLNTFCDDYNLAKDYSDDTTTIYSLGTDLTKEKLLNLIPDVEYPTLTVQSIDGGGLLAGSYQFAVAYKLKTGDYTDYSLLSPTYFAAPKYNESIKAGQLTSRKFQIDITNIDSQFDECKLGIIYKGEDEEKAYEYENIDIKGKNSTTIYISGINSLNTVTLNDIVIGNISYIKDQAHTNFNSQLIRANVSMNDITGLDKHIKDKNLCTANGLNGTGNIKIKEELFKSVGDKGDFEKKDLSNDTCIKDNEYYFLYLGLIDYKGKLINVYPIYNTQKSSYYFKTSNFNMIGSDGAVKHRMFRFKFNPTDFFSKLFKDTTKIETADGLEEVGVVARKQIKSWVVYMAQPNSSNSNWCCQSLVVRDLAYSNVVGNNYKGAFASRDRYRLYPLEYLIEKKTMPQVKAYSVRSAYERMTWRHCFNRQKNDTKNEKGDGSDLWDEGGDLIQSVLLSDSLIVNSRLNGPTIKPEFIANNNSAVSNIAADSSYKFSKNDGLDDNAMFDSKYYPNAWNNKSYQRVTITYGNGDLLDPGFEYNKICKDYSAAGEWKGDDNPNSHGDDRTVAKFQWYSIIENNRAIIDCYYHDRNADDIFKTIDVYAQNLSCISPIVRVEYHPVTYTATTKAQYLKGDIFVAFITQRCVAPAAGFQHEGVGATIANCHRIIISYFIFSRMNLQCRHDGLGVNSSAYKIFERNISNTAENDIEKAIRWAPKNNYYQEADNLGHVSYPIDNFWNTEDGKCYETSMNWDGFKDAVIIKKIDDIKTFPSRIIRSDVNPSESTDIGWRRYKADAYKDVSIQKGAIENVLSDDIALYIQQQYTLLVAAIKDTLGNNDENTTYVGTSDLFQREPKEIIYSTTGKIGCNNRFSAIITHRGYLVCDVEKGEIYLVKNDQSVSELSDLGFKEWFKEHIYANATNPLSHSGCFFTYDEMHQRFIFTNKIIDKNGAIDLYKSYSISYSLKTNLWTSFHSYIGDYSYINRHGIFYITKGSLFKTDAKNKGIYFDDVIHPSVVQFIYATEPTISKLFKHIEWRSQLINGLMNNEDNIRYLYNKTIDWLMFHTDVQCTGLMPMSVSPIWWDNETLKYKAGRYLWNRIEDFVENDHGQWNPNPNLINFMDKDAIDTLIELSAKYQKPWYDIAKFHNAWTYITMIYENKFFSQEADDYVDDITKYPDATQLDLRLTNIEVMIDKDTRL